MNIVITDGKKDSTVIGAGPKDHGTKPTTAEQIDGWKATDHVRKPDGTGSRDSPFGVGGGECQFDRAAPNTLFCFAGAKTGQVLLALRDFPLYPAAGATGSGDLNAPPSRGALAKGAITWKVESV
jgi:hypothetical protein